MGEDHDFRVRREAFRLLEELRARYDDEVLPRKALQEGFLMDGIRVPLVGPQGIFKPRILDLPLSITTAPNGPYGDRFSEDGRAIHYRYRGADPQHRDNVGLRELMKSGRPLIYLHGIVPGRYLPEWPAYVIGDQPANLTFVVAVDYRQEALAVQPDLQDLGATEQRRRYKTAAVRVRLHQRAFRERVLAAYRGQCALCRLRHLELLEAAHITPDSSPRGEPLIRNGLALCKLHHAAFDRNILGITPDCIVKIRTDILDEIDGPMLQHGLQEMHDSKLYLPRRFEDRPDPEALAHRYESFLSG